MQAGVRVGGTGVGVIVDEGEGEGVSEGEGVGVSVIVGVIVDEDEDEGEGGIGLGVGKPVVAEGTGERDTVETAVVLGVFTQATNITIKTSAKTYHLRRRF